LDNLDRVDAADALRTLSTLQAFVDKPHTTIRKGHLFVLIPYDPSSMRRLWHDDAQLPAEPDEDSGPSAPHEASVALSMLDKKFLLRFTIGPLVLSDWRQYLLGLLRQALPEHGEEERESVYELFRTARLAVSSHPTPRDLKLFVNQLGAVHRLWQDEFPLVQMAYFAFLVREGTDIPSQITRGLIPSEAVLPILGDSPQDNITAMAFNVPVGLARQLRLVDPMTRALQKGDAQSLSALMATSEGALDVLATIDFSGFAKSEGPFQLADAALALHESKLAETANQFQWKTIVRRLRSAFSAVKTWRRPTIKAARGVAAAVTVSKDPTLPSDMLAALSRAPVEQDETKIQPTDVSALIDAAITLLEVSSSLGFELPHSIVKPPLPPSHYITAMAHLAEKDPERRFWTSFTPQGEPGQVMTALSASISAGTVTASGLPTVLVLKAQDVTWPWQEPLSAILTRMGQNITLPAGEARVLLSIAWELRDVSPEGSQSLNNLVSQGALSHHFYNSLSQRDWPSAAWLMYSILKLNPSLKATQDLGNSSAGTSAITNLLQKDDNPDVRQHFVGIIRTFHDSGLLAQLESDLSYAIPFIYSTLEEISTGPVAEGLLDVDFLCDSWDFLDSVLEQSALDGVVAKVLHAPGPSPIVERGFSIPLAGLYSAIIRETTPLNSQFLVWCVASLKALDEATWAEQLAEEGDLVQLVIELEKHGASPGLGTPFLDALTAHSSEVIRGEATVTGHADDWPILPKALEGDHRRKTLSRDLLDVVIQVGAGVPPEVFRLYGPSLSDTEVLGDNSALVRGLFTPLLENRHEKGLEWIASLVTAHPEFLKRYKPTDTVQDFRDRLGPAATQPTDAATAYIKTVALALGVEIKETVPEDDEPDPSLGGEPQQ